MNKTGKTKMNCLALLSEVSRFGKQHQLEFIEGPVGFSNLDKAGLLVS